MKYLRRTAVYTWDRLQKQNKTKQIKTKKPPQIAKELKVTLILDKLLEYKRIWIQHVNRMRRNRLPGVMKH